MGLICSIQSGKVGGVSGETAGNCSLPELIPKKLHPDIPMSNVKTRRYWVKILIIIFLLIYNF